MDAAKKQKIDFSQMGEADKRNLCTTCLEAVKRFYDDPTNRDRFERWLQTRRQTRTVAAQHI